MMEGPSNGQLPEKEQPINNDTCGRELVSSAWTGGHLFFQAPQNKFKLHSALLVSVFVRFGGMRSTTPVPGASST